MKFGLFQKKLKFLFGRVQTLTKSLYAFNISRANADCACNFFNSGGYGLRPELGRATPRPLPLPVLGLSVDSDGKLFSVVMCFFLFVVVIVPLLFP